jgi:hypothetical protein
MPRAFGISTLDGFVLMPKFDETVPVQVAIIFEDYVRVNGDVSHLWPRMREAGYADKLFTDEHGYSAIRFEPGADHFKNIPLLTLLLLLNDLGIPFAADFKQLWSPASLMQELQRKRVLRKPFHSISKCAAGWNYVLHEPTA